MLINRDLRALVLGQFVSAVGDHFYLIAMPWLALTITGRAFVAGTLLAVASLPRAAFMLLGGVMSDRYSPKRMLIMSNGLQGVLMAALAVAMLARFSPLWLLYLIAFLAGLVDAFGLPAFSSMLPQLVEDDQLESGNFLLQGANMLSGAVGPALAGLIIAGASSDATSGPPFLGMAAAFGTNSLTFFLGISLFFQIRAQGVTERRNQAPLLSSIGDLVLHLRQDPRLIRLFGLMVLLSLFLTGALRIGFPLLAERLPGAGVREFGLMSSTFGAGMLAGMAGLRILPPPRASRSGLVILLLFAVIPVGLVALGLGPSLPMMLAVILGMGASFGYVLIYLLSWLQRRTPPELLGRVMALVLFTTIGMAPLSQALMGYLLEVSLSGSLIGVGALILTVLLAVGSDRRMWSLDD